MGKFDRYYEVRDTITDKSIDPYVPEDAELTDVQQEYLKLQ